MGAGFALRGAMRTLVTLNRAEPIAGYVFPLAERLDTAPWMRERPCMPDVGRVQAGPSGATTIRKPFPRQNPSGSRLPR